MPGAWQGISLMPPANHIKELTPQMRLTLRALAVLLAVLGVPLLALADQTARFAAWDIQPPAAAMTLGAAYLGMAALAWFAAQQHSWARARMAVPPLLAFTALTLVMMLLHPREFHLDMNLPSYTLALTWVWLATHLILPLALGIFWVGQVGLAGQDPFPQLFLPEWARWVASAQALVLVSLGVSLFLLPAVGLAWWLWPVDELTGRAFGIWLLSLGLLVAQCVLENDWARARPLVWSLGALGVLLALTVWRYGLDFAQPLTWGYVALWFSLMGLAGHGWLASRRLLPER